MNTDQVVTENARRLFKNASRGMEASLQRIVTPEEFENSLKFENHDISINRVVEIMEKLEEEGVL